jgi:hypothetical protein
VQPEAVRVSPLIIAAMKDEGVNSDRLQHMLKHSIHVTHVGGNRRYHDYLFTVEGNVLWAVKKMRTVADEIITLEKPDPQVVEQAGGARVRKRVDVVTLRARNPAPAILKRPPGTKACTECEATGKVCVFDPCDCEGANPECPLCDEGLVKNDVTCPMCKGARYIKL